MFTFTPSPIKHTVPAVPSQTNRGDTFKENATATTVKLANCSVEGRRRKRDMKRYERDTTHCRNPERIHPSRITCEASTEFDKDKYGCDHAFSSDKTTRWASHGEGVGAWIKATFCSTKYITKMELLQGNVPSSANKRVTIEFNPDEQPKSVTLKKIGNRESDYNIINLSDDNIRADYVNITITAVYGQVNNGFSVIKIWGCDYH